ncbi:MAG: hemolysin III family protein [Treponema sp.]|jgi:hemolysin III|nr:hemolysin III family protein [Treponema sp.]
MTRRTTEKRGVLPRPLPFQTPGEETANSILHGLGTLLSAAGFAVLITKPAGTGGDPLVYAAYGVFSVALVVMFLASTLYHAIQPEDAKRVLRVLDHGAIYLLIAGTYTPFCLLGLKGVLGGVFLAFEWALAAAGITLYAINWKFIKKFELVVYILMGWAIAALWIPLSRAIPRPSLVFLVAGGVFYTLGTIWYARPNRRGAHIAWHTFVLCGAACHWGAVWFLG